MSRLITAICLMFALILPVNALDMTAPTVPESGAELLQDRPDSFSEGLMALLKEALPLISPAFSESINICAQMIAVCLMLSLFSELPGQSAEVISLSGAILLGTMILSASRSFVQLGTDTVEQLSEYGKLLLPVMTAAMTAEGGITASTAIYAGTAFFDALLSAAIAKLMVPLIYIYLCLTICAGAIEGEFIQKLQDFIKWLMTWILKTILYLFTGYIGITGVVSGSTDASALKAAKLMISGVVPVVGGILSDASDAVLVSASVVKNAAGIYGMLAVIAVWISPFIQIGMQYLLVKATGACCAMFAPKPLCKVISGFSGALGMLVAMTGAVCLMLMISIVCFMREVG